MLSIPALMLLTTGFSPTASAQDLDSLDDAEEEEPTRNRRTPNKPDVKEINKGFYAKANVGGAGYLLDFRGFAKAGTAVGLSVGNDFLDREKTSAAWEIGVMQGIHNGCDYQSQAAMVCSGNKGGTVPSPLIQGDFRTYSFLANIEASKYPARRIGLGVRLGGGGLISPLLMDEGQYLEEVVGKEWGGQNPGYHQGFKPLGFGGITAEYYSKLSHFSIGGDFDVFYAVGFDMGFNGTGYLKYTF